MRPPNAPDDSHSPPTRFGNFDRLSVLSEVRYQCFLQYAGPPGKNAMRGMGVRFVQFDTALPKPQPGVREVVMQ